MSAMSGGCKGKRNGLTQRFERRSVGHRAVVAGRVGGGRGGGD